MRWRHGCEAKCGEEEKLQTDRVSDTEEINAQYMAIESLVPSAGAEATKTGFKLKTCGVT
jgi:hypothetical protein